MKVGVTGAGGYVGGRLLKALQARGHESVALGRRPLPGSEYEFHPYDLRETPDAGLLQGLDAVVHCAWDMQARTRAANDQINVGAVRRLVDAAKLAGTQVCLISSMSAYPGTRQIYGEAKLRCERLVADAGGKSVRLGLVYGRPPAGMFSALCRLARLPVVPLIGARSHQFLVHQDDMVAGITALLEQPRVPQPIGLAHPVPVSFRALMRDLSARQGGRSWSFPVPWRPVYRSMSLAEAAGLPLPIRSDSVLGLVRPAREVPNDEFWRTVGVRIRPYEFRAAV
jgi:nucleoside-diphosphate-sugar epimerase